MRKIFLMAAVAAMAMGVSSCVDNQFDEQMEARSVMNKSGKTETAHVKDKTAKGPDKNEKNGIMLCAPSKTKTEKDQFAKGKDKNEKNGVMPIMETRSAIVYRPLGETYGQYNSDGPSKPVKK